MNMNILPVSSLSPNDVDQKIRVKVIRLWIVRGPDVALPFSMEMVLMDAEGSKIGAHVCRNDYPIFSQLIVENQTYVMHGFNVDENYDYDRTNMNPLKIYFYDDTVVHHDQTAPIVGSPFTFIPIEELRIDIGKPSYLVDVIGVITSVSAELSYTVQGNIVRMRSIEISANGYKVTCHLSGRFADEFNAFMLAGAENVKIAIQYAKKKSYKGNLCITLSPGQSRLLLNPDIVEAEHILP